MLIKPIQSVVEMVTFSRVCNILRKTWYMVLKVADCRTHFAARKLYRCDSVEIIRWHRPCSFMCLILNAAGFHRAIARCLFGQGYKQGSFLLLYVIYPIRKSFSISNHKTYPSAGVSYSQLNFIKEVGRRKQRACSHTFTNPVRLGDI
jgi:hypothetical protein